MSFILPVPLGREETDGLLEGGSAPEIGWGVVAVCFLCPVGMVAAVVGAVELVVGIHPPAEYHQFHVRQHGGVIVLCILRVVGVGQELIEFALVRAEAFWRQECAVVVAPVALLEGSEFWDNGSGKFPFAQFLIGGAVIQGNIACEVQAAVGILAAVTGYAFGIEQGLYIRGVVNNLLGASVAAVFD